ncbi:hypothetical protein BPAE_0023g00270 [Botrytis paeoniae]|uniref:Uncharacterized protein n=1 Tax=Botrytis paeoniae TaxID=278948 RepID=A0A4Z1G0B9_9HELO|nr:hypothetical protein BPAE_0023g00270 [Botrytis paeoniae]
MNSGDMDRVPLDGRMFPNDEAPPDSRICEVDRQNERTRSIAKEYEDLEAQKAEFEKLKEDHKSQVHEFEEAKVEFEDKVMVHKTQVDQIVTNAPGKLRTFNKMELENDRKLDLLRAEQCKFNTAVKEFNKRLEKAREATKIFNKKVETLRGMLMAAKQREKSFLKRVQIQAEIFGGRENRGLMRSKTPHCDLLFSTFGFSRMFEQAFCFRLNHCENTTVLTLEIITYVHEATISHSKLLTPITTAQTPWNRGKVL